MNIVRVRAAVMAAALAQALAAAPAGAAESPSYTAYSQGRYLTALKLAEEEAAKGSKEAFTLMGEIYSEGLGVAQDFEQGGRRLCQGRRSRRRQRPVLAGAAWWPRGSA